MHFTLSILLTLCIALSASAQPLSTRGQHKANHLSTTMNRVSSKSVETSLTSLEANGAHISPILGLRVMGLALSSIGSSSYPVNSISVAIAGATGNSQQSNGRGKSNALVDAVRDLIGAAASALGMTRTSIENLVKCINVNSEV